MSVPVPYLRASLDSSTKHSSPTLPANKEANFHLRHSRREYHIVVLGAGGVGKSCLTGKETHATRLFAPNRLSDGSPPAQFVQNIWIESYDPTIEDSYRKVLAVDGRPCLLEMYVSLSSNMAQTIGYSWNGTVHRNERTPSHPSSQAQRSTTATHKAIRFRELYMKQGEGFLLVFSITSMSSLNELQELREQIIRIKDDEKVPIVIVGNKSDLEEDRAVSRSRAFALSQQWGNAPYYETSARRRANVDEAFIDLCRQIIRKDIRSNKDRDREYGGSRKKEAGGGADKRRNRRRTKMKTDCVIL
ncbi:Ras-related protein rsr1 [Microsporum ferrugineum]